MRPVVWFFRGKQDFRVDSPPRIVIPWQSHLLSHTFSHPRVACPKTQSDSLRPRKIKARNEIFRFSDLVFAHPLVDDRSSAASAASVAGTVGTAGAASAASAASAWRARRARRARQALRAHHVDLALENARKNAALAKRERNFLWFFRLRALKKYWPFVPAFLPDKTQCTHGLAAMTSA